ncbi:MAG: uridine kinase [Bdellovibrionota bacterium]
MTDFTKQSRPSDSVLTSTRTRPYILGVAGGSGSGKTYFARDLLDALGDKAEIIYQDNFYIDNSKKFDFDGGSVNFDHPESIDFDLLGEHIAQLKEGKAVDIPIYDFATHSRRPNKLHIRPRPIIIVDGILIFHAEQVRKHFDDMVFFDTPEELRFERRLERDVKERGRKPEGVKNQFLKQVKPMHDQFVEPSKKYATTIVKEISEYEYILSDYCAKLKKKT